MTLLRESFKTTRRPLSIFFFIYKSKTTYFFWPNKRLWKAYFVLEKTIKKKKNEREIFLLIDFFFFYNCRLLWEKCIIFHLNNVLFLYHIPHNWKIIRVQIVRIGIYSRHKKNRMEGGNEFHLNDNFARKQNKMRYIFEFKNIIVSNLNYPIFKNFINIWHCL